MEEEGGEERGKTPRRDHARGSRVKKLRNGIEFETCLLGSSECGAAYSCHILA